MQTCFPDQFGRLFRGFKNPTHAPEDVINLGSSMEQVSFCEGKSLVQNVCRSPLMVQKVSLVFALPAQKSQEVAKPSKMVPNCQIPLISIDGAVSMRVHHESRFSREKTIRYSEAGRNQIFTDLSFPLSGKTHPLNLSLWWVPDQDATGLNRCHCEGELERRGSDSHQTFGYIWHSSASNHSADLPDPP